MIFPCEQIDTRFGELFTCETRGEFTRIRTPFLYPDGDYIDLFFKEREGVFTLSDLGETLGWLKMQTLSPKRSIKQNQLINDICLTQGVELFRGMLTLRLKPGEDLTDGVLRLGQAAIRIADIWFTFRSRTVENIADEVGDFLDERKVAYVRGAKMTGRSGRGWTVAFHTRTPGKSSLVEILSTGSRGSANGIVKHVVTQWHDLSHLVASEQLQLISLFDDTQDVWSDEDFKILENLSIISRWSNPDQFSEYIQAA